MTTFQLRRVSVACLLAMLAAGCGSHQPPRTAAAPPPDSLETAITKIRQLQIAAKPVSERVQTIEASPGALRDALEAVVSDRGGPALRRAAQAYYDAGVLDQAYSYFTQALKVDSRDAAAYDGIARIWRDWGFPHLGVGDAHRATYYAPSSAAAYNTLGTLLHAVGNTQGARSAFQKALVLEPQAAYAHNNMCYLSFQAGDSVAAIDACKRALEIDPTLVPAQNNLALAFASQGDFQATAVLFARSGDAAARAFNLGIVMSAAGRYREAEQSFQTAAEMKPEWGLASDRARQAGRAADDEVARRRFLDRGATR